MITLCPLGQPEKAIGPEPQIEPWLTPYNHWACQVSETGWRRRDQKMNLPRWKNTKTQISGARHQSQASLVTDRGWTPRKFPRPPVDGEVFSLTSPFIEQGLSLVKAERTLPGPRRITTCPISAAVQLHTNLRSGSGAAIPANLSIRGHNPAPS